MMIKRKTARFLKEFKKVIDLSAFSSFIIGVAGLIIGFFSMYPNSPILKQGIVSSYLIINIALFIIVATITLWFGQLVIWLIVKNAPPLVNVKGHFLQDTAYLRLTNEEPVDLDYAQVNIGGLSLGNNPNSIEHLGHNNLIKIEQKIVTGEKVEIPIAVGEDGFTRFSVDGGLYNLALNDRENKESHGRYRIALEVFAHPVDEEKSMLVGRYFGAIYHTRLNGTKPPANDKHRDDVLIYQDMVGWEKGSFKSMTEKEYRDFINPSLTLTEQRENNASLNN